MLNATLVRRVEITKDLIIMSVKPDDGVPEFKPGQYVALGLPEAGADGKEKLIKRAYSIGSSPEDRGALEFFYAVVASGELTPKLVALKEGDRLYCAPKIVGTFTLDDVPADANLVLVSTGTGIAPFMSMLRTRGTWHPGRRITLIHGVRYVSDLAYVAELTSLAKNDPRFRYISTVSRADASWSGNKGYVQKILEEGDIPLEPSRDHVFACGNPAMIGDLEKLLTDKGYIVHAKKTPGSLHLEKYW